MHLHILFLHKKQPMESQNKEYPLIGVVVFDLLTVYEDVIILEFAWYDGGELNNPVVVD